MLNFQLEKSPEVWCRNPGGSIRMKNQDLDKYQDRLWTKDKNKDKHGRNLKLKRKQRLPSQKDYKDRQNPVEC